MGKCEGDYLKIRVLLEPREEILLQKGVVARGELLRVSLFERDI